MRWFCALLVLLLLLPPQPARADTGFVLHPPIPGVLLRGFDDVSRFEAGHRGVDLAGTAGQEILAAADGVVYFAGSVAARGTVSIDHGNGWRTTYQPVAAAVSRGEAVRAGQPIGTLLAGHCTRGCLHWGLTDGSDYLDPMAYLETPVVRLLPHGARPRVVPALGAARVPAAIGDAGGGVAGLPVQGRVSSPFGMRRHPVTGVYKLHDGLDLAAPCGTPIRAPAAGVVTRTGWHNAYGWRVFVEHDGGLSTAYTHLPRVDVAVGTRLAAGQQLGRVGTTGLSTGCHLHWMAWRSGELIDPLTLVRS